MNFFLVIMSDIQHHVIIKVFSNPLSGNFLKWSNTRKKFVGNLPTNCLSVVDHFVGLALKGLILLPIQQLRRGPVVSCYNVFSRFVSVVVFGRMCVRGRLQIPLLLSSEFKQIHYFYCLWNYQKTHGFLMISGGEEIAVN